MEALHQPGDIINQRYHILDTLGKGGIGTTYAAENLQTGERVALKVVSLRGTNDPKVLELFEREARILSQLNHPGIPRYLDYFQVNKRRNSYFYLAQQLVEGQSLFELVENGWQPQEVEVWHIANQILDILVYLQQFTPPVIHRDIKPQNIIRRSDGKVFLVDFGAVQDVYHGTLTGGSTVAGTYGYMAPEQFRGKTVLATDLYGLGATLIFLLTQKDPADLPKRKLKIDFRRQVQVTKRFADWLEGMIEPVAEDRFRSAGEALMVWQGKKELSSSTTPENPASNKAQSHLKIDSSLPSGCLLRRANSKDKYKLAKLIYSETNFDFYPNSSNSFLVNFLLLTLVNLIVFLQLTILVLAQLLIGAIAVIWVLIILTYSLIVLCIFWFFIPMTILKIALFIWSKFIGISLILSLVLLLFFCLVSYLIGAGFCMKITVPLLMCFDSTDSKVLSYFVPKYSNIISISNCWVIECNKNLIAFGSLRELDKNLYINQLFVEKKWRRKGLGSALAKHLIQETTKPVYVCSPFDLVNFYSRLGFVPSRVKGINIKDSFITITLIYNNQFGSASEETDSRSNLKSEGSLMALAKQSNAKAIATLLSQHLQGQKINIKASIKNNCLIILSESYEVPNQHKMSTLICKKIADYGINDIDFVKVYGRCKREEHPAWKYEFKIVAPSDPPLPLGCILRKANSKDKSKFLKFELTESWIN